MIIRPDRIGLCRIGRMGSSPSYETLRAGALFVSGLICSLYLGPKSDTLCRQKAVPLSADE